MKLSLVTVLAAAVVFVAPSVANEPHLRRSLANNNGNNGNNGNGGNSPEEEDDGNYDGNDPQTVDDSRTEDIQIIAGTNGWSLSDTEKIMDLQDAFKGLVSKLKDNNRFSESMMAEAPGSNPKVLFKNGVPPQLEDEIAEFEVQNNVVVDRVETKFSRKDQENRAKRMKNKLRAKGFGDLNMAIIGDALKISAQKPLDNDDIKPTPPGRGNIPPGQVDEVAADILGLGHDDDEVYGLQLDIYEGDAAIGGLDHTRGGRKIYNGSTGGHCTTAFSVRQKSTGITGVLSAGHCGASMNRYDAEDSGLYNSPESDYSLYHRGTDWGPYGDFAWYTTNHWELPQYWASPTSMRRVTGWDYHSSINENVCVYSRINKERVCTKVYTNGFSVDWACCPPFHNLVAVTNMPTIEGDSGGPWSWNTVAYGVTSGWNYINGVKRAVYSQMYWLRYAFGGDIELLCDGFCYIQFP